MFSSLNRRHFLRLGLTASAAIATPNWILAQAAAPDRVQQGRDAAAKTPIKTTKLADNVYLLQGAGGNMVAQTGPDGKILIDSSFSTAVPAIREALAALSKDPASTLINTHWHFDHTDGNEGLHQAGFKILAHTNTKARLSTPQSIKFFHLELPAAPEGARPTRVFDDTLELKQNGDTLSLVHFAPAHTDTDIYIHFAKADVLHCGDTFFNGFYPFIDESSGGNITGMVNASQKSLSLAGPNTKIIPGHGPLGDKTSLQSYHDMLAGIRDKVAALKSAGASEQEAIAKKPTAPWDDTWGNGMLAPDIFTGIVYRTV